MNIKVAIRQLVLIICMGAVLALSNSFFIRMLNWIERVRLENLSLHWGLPIFGIIIVLLHRLAPKDFSEGLRLVRSTVLANSSVKRPKFFGFYAVIATFLTHLGGGSAGREGTAVQLSVWLIDFFGRLHPRLLDLKIHRAAAGVGFAMATGSPLAGLIFFVEFFKGARESVTSWLKACALMVTAWSFERLLQTPHLQFPQLILPELLSIRNIGIFFILAVIFGVAARIYLELYMLLKSRLDSINLRLELKIMCGGILLSSLYFLEGSYQFSGLGLALIDQAFLSSQESSFFLFKVGFTLLTLSFGFKGGEFIPLVFIGAFLGSYLGGYLSPELGPWSAALGSVVLYSILVHVPFTGVILGATWFGWKFFIIGLPVVLISNRVLGGKRLYAKPF